MPDAEEHGAAGERPRVARGHRGKGAAPRANRVALVLTCKEGEKLPVASQALLGCVHAFGVRRCLLLLDSPDGVARLGEPLLCILLSPLYWK